MSKETNRYMVTVLVEYCYEVEAEDDASAEEQGWSYEDYKYNATVDTIRVEALDEGDEV